MKLVVSDASPLIVIAKSGLIPMLNGMVEEVVIPKIVYAECARDPGLPVGSRRSGCRIVRDGLNLVDLICVTNSWLPFEAARRSTRRGAQYWNRTGNRVVSAEGNQEPRNHFGLT